MTADERAGREDRPGADRDSRPARGNTGPQSRPGSRRTGSGLPSRGDDLPDVRPRPGRGGKQDDSDWPTKKWDELSDVDYWAELAAEKPFSSPSELDPAPRGERSETRRDSDSGQSRGPARTGPSRNGQSRVPAGADVTQKLPVRSPRPERPLGEPAGVGGAAGRSVPMMPPVRRAPAGIDATAALSAPRVPQADRSWPAAPTKDDPLTSPSFPKIDDDSRSYRRGRGDITGQWDSGNQRTGTGPRDRRSDAEQTRQYPSYPLPAAASSPYDSGSRPVPAEGWRSASPVPDQAAAATGQYAYPQSSQAPYQPPSQPDQYGPADQYSQHSYQPGTAAYQIAPSTGTRSPGSPNPASPNPGPQSGPHSYPGRSAAAQASGTQSYSREALPPGYSSGSYQVPPQPGGYGGRTDSGPHQSPSGTYPGYSQPTPADPYAQSSPGQYPSAYPQAALPAGPTAAYPTPAGVGQDYAGQGGFNGYGSGQFADNGHQVPAGYRPGDYQAAPYAPPAYQAPGYEPPAVPTGDPYAVDPYGQAGYGGGGF